MIELDKSVLSGNASNTSAEFINIAHQVKEIYNKNYDQDCEQMEQGEKRMADDSWCFEAKGGTISVKNLKQEDCTWRASKVTKTEDSSKSEIHYKCITCGKSYSSKSSWIRHTKSHKPGIQRCSICNMFFDNAELLQSHNDVYHGSLYMCSICGAAMSRKSTLRRHMVTIHPNQCQKKIKCPFSPCIASFDYEDQYLDHLNIHEGKTPHECKHCKKRFALKSILRHHEINHFKEPQYTQCDDCGKTFRGAGALCNHKASVHNNTRYTCNCGKIFNYPSGLARHLKNTDHIGRKIVVDHVEDTEEMERTKTSVCDSIYVESTSTEDNILTPETQHVVIIADPNGIMNNEQEQTVTFLPSLTL